MKGLALVTLAACSGAAPRTIERYAAPATVLTNPERGFVVDVDLVDPGDLDAIREAGGTLGFAAVRLDAFRDAALSDALLAALTDGFAAVRAAGLKVIVRFIYNRDAHGVDAPRDQVLAHIWQLQPLLIANADVIAVLDAGFIGAWGEWHTSIHGLDNAADRSTILGALLAAVPASRSIVIRSPAHKKEMFGGPLTAEAAFDGSGAARVGHLNGCFLASDTDQGTYLEPIEAWKAFVAEEGRFVPVGGETCHPNPPRSDCKTATAELARMHWSFLNSLYHPQVLNAWQDQDCYDEIGQRLGYRLEVIGTSFEAKVAPGGVLHVHVELVNTGYAAMFNARPVLLRLGDLVVETPIDPRRWEPGKPASLTIEVPIPPTMTPGSHRLSLWLPDAAPSLRHDSRYAVRLANTPWDPPLNVLSDDVVVGP